MRIATGLIITILTCCLATGLYAENTNPLDEMLFDSNQNTDNLDNPVKEDSLVNDIIRVNYEKKNAQLAMMMSAILPGAGQFYVDKSALTAYIFPLIELAVIGGIIYYDSQGDKKATAYKKYVNEEVTFVQNGYTYTGTRYNRDFQTAVEDTLIRIHTADIYDGDFFSLDNVNSLHFYEDIGNNNKYIFGWVDWYLTYAEASPDLENLDPHPIFIFDYDDNDPVSNIYDKWRYNRVPGDTLHLNHEPYSALRAEYAKMRKAAEDEYKVANYLAFGIAINHIISAIDAARTAKSQNRVSLSQNKIKLKYYAAVNDGHLTPMLGLRVTF